MNKKGFTLIELLAVIILLGIIMGITIVSVKGIFNNTKEKSEDAFVATIKDAMEIYLASDAKELSYSECRNTTLEKTHNTRVKVYKATPTPTFQSVIESKYGPITAKDMVNPANKDKQCNTYFNVSIYVDEDYVYYYKIDGNSLECLTKKNITISNLPEGFSC